MPLELMIAVPVSRRISLLLESLVSKAVSNPQAHMCPPPVVHTSTSNTGNAQLFESPHDRLTVCQPLTGVFGIAKGSFQRYERGCEEMTTHPMDRNAAKMGRPHLGVIATTFVSTGRESAFLKWYSTSPNSIRWPRSLI